MNIENLITKLNNEERLTEGDLQHLRVLTLDAPTDIRQAFEEICLITMFEDLINTIVTGVEASTNRLKPRKDEIRSKVLCEMYVMYYNGGVFLNLLKHGARIATNAVANVAKEYNVQPEVIESLFEEDELFEMLFEL